MTATLTFLIGLAELSFAARMLRNKGVDTIEEFIGRATIEEMIRIQAHAKLGFLLWGVAAILSVMRL